MSDQNPEHVIATPVAGSDDLDKELTQAKRGLSKPTIGLGVVALALVAFFGGVWTHSAIAGSGDTAARSPQRQGGQRFLYPPDGGGGPGGPGGQGGGGQGGGFRGGTAGTVDRVEGDTIYVKPPDGSEVKVTTSESTKVETSTAGKLSDITPGSSVVVQGQRGEDGVTASTITRRPAS
ncbi:hypothetical protein [Kibdelosporangium phytohabitans]|uniref:Uncharacterized protein n=1 Tax=Kibdelosporangium phytohabitans TaxID=860235 RepID=A0A0N7F5E5_9PSEU|nr:hypothetical protein [Kibdelosporangium phytohabitans]ALG14007.1 hypothetical protein AOZ06_50435 [Kibdelosporangium phytohabitans]MBE1467038.1 hypothetical protein [Kibdelosporangium phytohabitans]